jgi:hypothetical protein
MRALANRPLDFRSGGRQIASTYRTMLVRFTVWRVNRGETPPRKYA